MSEKLDFAGRQRASELLDWIVDCPEEAAHRLAALEAGPAALKDELELAWGIIANASDWNIDEGDTPCGKKAKEWQNAAARWRDRYHALLTAEEDDDETQ